VQADAYEEGTEDTLAVQRVRTVNPTALNKNCSCIANKSRREGSCTLGWLENNTTDSAF